jgi:predicted RNase H-like nuclease (RuvC/YqgF family)
MARRRITVSLTEAQAHALISAAAERDTVLEDQLGDRDVPGSPLAERGALNRGWQALQDALDRLDRQTRDEDVRERLEQLQRENARLATELAQVREVRDELRYRLREAGGDPDAAERTVREARR